MSTRKPPPRRPVQSRRGLVLSAAAVIVVAVVVIGGLYWNSKRTQTRNDGYGTTKAPVAVSESVVRVGLPNATTTIDLYEDFQCPVCAQLEKLYGQQLAQSIDEGKVAVDYHMLHFLNRNSASKNYSDRAAGAALCVAQDGTGSAFAAFHSSLFTNQPEEGASSDLSNDQLADLAGQAGASDAAAQCVATGAQTAAAAAAAAAGEQQLAAALGTDSIGTPTVLRNGQQVNLNDSNWVSDLG